MGRRPLRDATALLLDLAARLGRGLERPFGVDELPVARHQLGRDVREPALDAPLVVLEGLQPDAAPGLGGQGLPGPGLQLDGAAELELGSGLALLGLAEPALGILQRPDGAGAGVGRRADALVEAVEPLARGLPPGHPLLPAARPASALAVEVAQSRRRELDRDRVGVGGELLVPLGHLRLLPKRLQLPAELGEHVLQAQEVLVEPRQLAFGALLALAVLRDPGGLLDVLAALLGPGGQDALELPLPDDGVEGAADTALGQELLDVEQAHDLAADPVLAVARAEDRPADLDLAHRHRDQAGGVVDHQLDLGHPEGGALRAPGEDHVGHLAAAEGSRPLLAEHPADRVDEVGLARPVGADDHRDTGRELQCRLVGERLEAAHLEGSEEHR